VALLNRWPRRRNPATENRRTAEGRLVKSYEAGRYIGCPACGRLLKIEWAVRSLVCSCGARVPVSPPDGDGA
jgi:hypothetical protein